MKPIRFSRCLHAILGMLLLFFLSSSVKAEVLNVVETTQEMDQWCWAGVSYCVLDYYNSTTPQCEIADYTRQVVTWHNFGTEDCCDNANAGCNYWNYNWGYDGSIQDILVHFGDISNYGTASVLSQQACETEIAGGKPFIPRWGWDSGGGHFIVGHGIETDGTFYYMDPWYGEGLKISTHSWVSRGGGHTWTHTNVMTTSPCECRTEDSCCDGCNILNEGGTCNADSNGCTVGDVCQGGVCEAGSAPSCSHLNDTCNRGVCVSTGEDSYNCEKDPSYRIGALCGDDPTECRGQAICNSEGVCQAHYAAVGTECGDAGTECINQDTCDGSGSCTDNGFQPSGTNCGNAGTECINQDTCDGFGSCTDNGFAAAETACGEAPTQCSAQDTCDGSGTCQANDFESSVTCDDGEVCTYTDHCNGAGSCEGTSYECQAAICQLASACDGLGGCSMTPEINGTYCDEAQQGGERCYDGECLSISDGETCDLPVRLVVGEEQHMTLDGQINTFVPDEPCSSEAFSGPDLFVDALLEPGSYTLTVSPEDEVDVVLLLMTSCDPLACSHSINDGGAGETESYALEIPETGQSSLVLFAVDTLSESTAGGFDILLQSDGGLDDDDDVTDDDDDATDDDDDVTDDDDDVMDDDDDVMDDDDDVTDDDDDFVGQDDVSGSGSDGGCRSINTGAALAALLMLFAAVALRRKGWNLK